MRRAIRLLLTFCFSVLLGLSMLCGPAAFAETAGENPVEAAEAEVVGASEGQDSEFDVEARVGEIEAALPEDAGDADIVKACFDAVVNEGDANKLLPALFDAFEIQRVDVASADGEHEWLMVQVDGAWYHVDAANQMLLVSDDAMRALGEGFESWAVVEQDGQVAELPQAPEDYVFDNQSGLEPNSAEEQADEAATEPEGQPSDEQGVDGTEGDIAGPEGGAGDMDSEEVSSGLAPMAASRTQAEAVAWARDMADRHVYCGECVVLIKKYYEYLGVSMPNPYGNANTYANSDRVPAGFYVDNTPSLGAVYVEANYNPGHVSIVVGIDSAGTLTTVDSNVLNTSVGQYVAQYFPWKTGRTRADYAGVSGKYFVHPVWANPTPTVNFSSWSDNRYTFAPTATNADIGQQIDVSGGTATNTGMVLYDQNKKELARASNGSYYYRVHFNINTELHYTLTPATGYYYRFFVIVNGKTYWSEYQHFETLGAEMKSGYARVLPDGDYAIVPTATANSSTVYFLDIPGTDAIAPDRANIQIYSDQASKIPVLPTCDVWHLTYSDGFYTITQASSNKRLDVADASTARGANVHAWPANASTAQRWAISKNGNGYRIQAKCSGMSLDVDGGTFKNGQNVQVWVANDSGAQRWSFVPVSRKISEASISSVGPYAYTGSAIKPSPTVTWKGETLRQGTDYTLSYNNNVKVGTAMVTITGKGSYTGSISRTFRILFKDVTDSSSWYYDPVYQAVSLGIVNGYANGNFGPHDNVSRAQLATMLWNMAGRPAPRSGGKTFSDVTSSNQYYAPIRWAASVGVVNGYANGTFGPDRPVTRQELASMLANYARNVGGVRAIGSPSSYASMRDASSVASWARTSVGWCYEQRIMSGTSDGRIMPTGYATRCQTAAMLVALDRLI